MSIFRILGIILAVVGVVYMIQGALILGLILLLVGIFVCGGVRL